MCDIAYNPSNHHRRLDMNNYHLFISVENDEWKMPFEVRAQNEDWAIKKAWEMIDSFFYGEQVEIIKIKKINIGDEIVA